MRGPGGDTRGPDHGRGRSAKPAQLGTAGEDIGIRPPLHCDMGFQIHIGPRREGWEGSSPIAIGDGVWLGGGVIVLPGVTIGENTVVGAGAVVTRDLPDGVVAVGNPARVIREV